MTTITSIRQYVLAAEAEKGTLGPIRPVRIAGPQVVVTRRVFWYPAALAVAAMCLVATSTTGQAAVVGYELDKGQDFQQTSTLAPATPANYGAAAYLFSNNSSDLSTAQVTAPSPISPLALTLDTSGYVPTSNTVFSAVGAFTTKSMLDTYVPNNAPYQFSIGGGTLGSRTAMLTSATSDLFPAAIPAFSPATFDRVNSDAVATAPLQLTFNSFVAGGAINVAYTQVAIVSFNTVPGTALFSTILPTSATSMVVPAFTLQAGEEYSLQLTFVTGVSTPNAGFNGATSTVTFDNQTQVTFIARAPEPSSLVLVVLGAPVFIVARVRRGKGMAKKQPRRPEAILAVGFPE